MKKYILLLVFVFQMFSYADCTDRAYKLAVGESSRSLDIKRLADAVFIFVDPNCCCFANILLRFAKDTIKMTYIQLNPGTDALIKSLRNQLKVSDQKVKELVSLSYVNNMYSFYTSDTGSSTLTSTVDHCQDFTFDAKTNTDQFKREGILLEVLETLYYLDKISELEAVEAEVEIQNKGLK